MTETKKTTIRGQIKQGAKFCFAVSTVLAALAASTMAKRLEPASAHDPESLA